MHQLFNQSKQKIKYCYIVILLYCFLVFLFSPLTFAQEPQKYKAQYQIEYFPNLNGDSRVQLNIKIINLRSDVYVKQFSLTFPKSFAIEDIKARDDHDKVIPKIEYQERNLKVILTFNWPNIGKSSENNFYLTYFQKNLFKNIGNVWEIILPVINDQYNSPYRIIFHLPTNSNKKLSLAKPKPDLIRDNKIFWNNVKTKTVYAIFGESQFYQVDLTYHLKNDNLFPVYFDVAFPPETLYQKIFINSINPKPEKVYLDEDGNYLGRYSLKPKEKTQVVFNGFIETFIEPQDELLNYIRKSIDRQKKYLLSPQPFWTLKEKIVNSNRFKQLNTPQDIYHFVTKNLDYNYKRLSKNQKRLGANEIWNNPTQAVCLEFTDLFIALAREKGIYAREINGYGFSYDSTLRPLSLASDILHSWPEYFDEKKQIWVPVDPTWENTSGIDYFSSLDLNHLVFVIHGKNSSLPLSAGMYKLENSKDVMVKVVSTIPKENFKIKVDDEIKPLISDRKKYQAKVQITNQGNAFIKNYSLRWSSQDLEIKPTKISIPLLAPYQVYDYQISYYSKLKNVDKEEPLTLFLNNTPIRTKKIKIVAFYRDVFNKILAVFAGLVFLLVVYRLVLKYEADKK